MITLYNLLHLLDLELFKLIYNLPHTPVFDFLAFIIWKYLGLIFVLIAVCLWFIFDKKQRYLVYLAIAMLSISALINQFLLKPSFARSRPVVNVENINIFYNLLTDYSFPSGHSTSVMAFSLPLIIFSKKKHIRLSLIFLIFITGFNRVYMGHHYPSDVIAGFITGSVISLSSSWFWSYLQRR